MVKEGIVISFILVKLKWIEYFKKLNLKIYRRKPLKPQFPRTNVYFLLDNVLDSLDQICLYTRESPKVYFIK